MKRVFDQPGPEETRAKWIILRELVLSVIFIVGGTMALFAARFPLSDTAPTGTIAVVGLLSVAVGLTVFLPSWPIPEKAVLAYLLVGIFAVSFLAAVGTTQLGTAISAMSYLWLCVFFGAYLEPRSARSLVAVLCISFGIALNLSTVTATASLWVVFSVTMVVTTEALLATNQALRDMARQDPLTGLLNRRGLEGAIESILAIGERISQPTSVVLIDLDDFKEVNDTKGHAAGDLILRDLASAWSGEKRDADLLARYGGDEFVVVMPATNAHQATELVSRWAGVHPVEWSFGVAEVAAGETLQTVMERADRDLYRAKSDRLVHR